MGQSRQYCILESFLHKRRCQNNINNINPSLLQAWAFHFWSVLFEPWPLNLNCGDSSHNYSSGHASGIGVDRRGLLKLSLAMRVAAMPLSFETAESALHNPWTM
ncbi:hypothetical protein TNCV_4463581 [Trichonephila clavipes]|nr:hypothetical protein TNCV_4463581 [Trichonephila clavipes]